MPCNQMVFYHISSTGVNPKNTFGGIFLFVYGFYDITLYFSVMEKLVSVLSYRMQFCIVRVKH